MVAAAITLWTMFSLWLIVPIAGLPGGLARAAAVFVSVELLALFTWSYGTELCGEPTCAPLAQAAGVAARIDIPALAAAFLIIAFRRLARGWESWTRSSARRAAAHPVRAADVAPKGRARVVGLRRTRL